MAGWMSTRVGVNLAAPGEGPFLQKQTTRRLNLARPVLCQDAAPAGMACQHLGEGSR